MNMLRPITILLLLWPLYGAAQDSTASTAKWSVNGYIKNLESLNFSKDFRDQVSGNLIHNRTNIRWKPTNRWTAGVELRNRFFWGEEIRSQPDFSKQLRNNSELMNLSVRWLSKNSYVLHTQIDRLWTEYQHQRLTIRVGRQRINWGQTTIWNPNDIFNTYNFLDFDYEERPGSDALQVKWANSDFASTSWVWAPGKRSRETVAAMKYAFNTQGYDVQLIGGWYKGQATVGAGWAGSLKDAGFKGEMQYYSGTGDSSGLFNLSLESDYAFKKGWYLNGGFLYNSGGLNRALPVGEKLSFIFSPKNLMPTRWNFTITLGKSFNPILNGNFTVLYAPGTQLLMVLPGMTCNLATNLDVDWIWQSFFAAREKHLEAQAHRMFLRLKWNF